MSAAIATDLRRLAGQLLMTGIPGTELDAATAQYLQQHGIRAVCLRAANLRDAAQLTRLNADLRRALGQQALIAIDPAGMPPAYPAWLPQLAGYVRAAAAQLAAQPASAFAAGDITFPDPGGPL